MLLYFDFNFLRDTSLFFGYSKCEIKRSSMYVYVCILINVVTLDLHDQGLNQLESKLVRVVVLIQSFLHIFVGIHLFHC